MGISRFFDKTVTQKRKASRTSHTVEAWTDISTTLKCCIYPAISPGDSIAFQSANFKLNITHKMNCLISEDVRIDDKIVYGSDEYIVKKVNSWDKFYEIFLSEIR